MSTTHSSFDQYCISHKTISNRATAAPGPEVRRECPMTLFPALPLLATNPGDATARYHTECVLQRDRIDPSDLRDVLSLVDANSTSGVVFGAK